MLGLLAVAAGAASPPESSASIPEAFQGRWDLKAGVCTDPNSFSAVEIGMDRLVYWEAGDEIISVLVERADTITLKVRQYGPDSDDPETAPVTSLRLALIHGGKHLKIQEKGKPSNTFSRCSGN